MSTIKKYLGQCSTLEIKQEILGDFQLALRLELEVELKQSEDNELFIKSNFYLRLDTAKVVKCHIFDLIQCFALNKKEAIDEALLERFNKQGSFKSNFIYVEHVGDNFHFFELVPREMNRYTEAALRLFKVAKLDSVEIPAIKKDAELWLKHRRGWYDLKENLDLVDWEIVQENQILGNY